MTVDELFQPKSKWKHRELEFLIVIREVVEPGRYRLSFDVPDYSTYEPGMDTYITRGIWTAEDLVRDFDPMMVAPTRYDRIADDDLFDDDPEEASP